MRTRVETSRPFLATVLAAALAASACQNDDYQPALPQALDDFYVRLQQDAARFPRSGGEWQEANGDPPFYGTAFYVRAGNSAGNSEYLRTAQQARDYAHAVLVQAARDPEFLLSDLEEVMMSGLGLCEYAAQAPDDPATAAFLPDLEHFIDVVNSVTIGLGRYVDIDAGQFAIKTYGPTAITAGVALLNLQYATYFHTPVAKERVDLARQIVETIDDKARFGDGYRIRPGDDLLDLYPNTMMMLVLARLYEQTGEVSYRDAAERVYGAIQPLRNPQRGGYYSPYSAAAMGATTSDYSTLSSQNYLTLALLILFEDTRRPLYYDEAKFVLGFIAGRLYDPQQGRVLHHFIDGHIARPTDPSYFCAGCNLQLLYVLWYAREHVRATTAGGAGEKIQ
jgi:hypothetical protein